MGTLFLICGLPGAGKTTLAKELEQQHSAIRFSPDEWISQIIADVHDLEELGRLRTPVETVQWQMAKRCLAVGCNVILEWGFWSREERDFYRREAEALGVRFQLFYLAVERDELWRRLEHRNANLPAGSFTVTEQELDLWSSWFQAPSPDELE
jgi:predicted kinase